MNMDHPIQAGDPLGLAIIVIGAIGTVLTFVLAFRMTVWPGETDPDHPKLLILRDDR